MTTLIGSTEPTNADAAYEQLLAALRERFAAKAGDATQRVVLFRTDVAEPYDVLLAALPAELHRTHACSACRRFVTEYGALVTIDERGQLESVLWDRASDLPVYGPAVRALARAVERADVTGPLVKNQEEWGTAEKGGFRHFAVRPPSHVLARESFVERPGQVAARKRHEHEILLRSLGEYPLALVRRAHSMLTTGALYRSEKCIGVAAWLVELHERRAAAGDARSREHVTWRASASAPAGFCHVRSGMIGTLLDDLAADLPFETVKQKFAAKMHPLQYMRPTAEPTAGNVAQAEKIIAALRAEGTLERRFARLEDLRPLWTPPQRPATPKKGVFGHLLAKDESRGTPTGVPPVTMTWEKFHRTVLPKATRIELTIPRGRSSFAAFVTAADAAAAPILQWDRPEQRNPVSWYLYHGGSEANAWNLAPGKDVQVLAIATQPSAWHAGTDFEHHGGGVMLVLEGARDREYKSGGGFFPESLKSELHPIRKTLEAHVKQAKIAGAEEATACGLLLSKGGSWDHLVHVVTRDGLRNTYKLDRWD